MISLGTVFGAVLKMHAALPVLVAAALWTGNGRALLAALFALSLHEAGHALSARAFGQRVESIELTPFGGVARLGRGPSPRPGQEAVVALAGPAASLLTWLVPAALGLTGPFVRDFLRGSLVLALFNLLPALPLDGGRALRAALSGRLGYARATKLFMRAGVAAGVLILALGLFAAFEGALNPLLFLSGAYLIYAALKEKDALAAACVEALHGRTERLRREGLLPVRWTAVTRGVSPERLVTRLTAGVYHLFVVVDDELRRVGTLDEGEVLRQAMAARIGPGGPDVEGGTRQG